MPVESLKSITVALLSHVPEEDDSSPRVITVKAQLPAPTPVRPNGQKVQPVKPTYEPSLVYILELATVLAMRDRDTVAEMGKEVAEALESAIRDSQRLHPIAVSRASYYLLSLLKACDDLEYVRTTVVLHTISSFTPDLLKDCAESILKGISECVKSPTSLRKEIATSPDFWAILQSLHEIADAAPLVFDILEDVAGGDSAAITADNYEPAISLLNAFATAGSIGAPSSDLLSQRPDGVSNKRGKAPPSRSSTPIQKPAPAVQSSTISDTVARGVRAIGIVHSMTPRVTALISHSHLETTDSAWHAYWSPIFATLTQQSTNPCRAIRSAAFSSLQRTLLSPSLASPHHDEWTNIFSEVLFPLIRELLKPEVFALDPVGMAETRVQAAQLLCKIYLHYLVLLSEWEGMRGLWMEILDVMDRLMNSGQGDTLVSLLSFFFNPLVSFSFLFFGITDGMTTGRSRPRIPQKRPPSHVSRWLSRPSPTSSSSINVTNIDGSITTTDGSTEKTLDGNLDASESLPPGSHAGAFPAAAAAATADVCCCGYDG